MADDKSIVLYHSPASRAFTAFWLLEELGLLRAARRELLLFEPGRVLVRERGRHQCRAGGGRGRVALAQQQLGVRARGARQLQGFQGVNG